MRAFVQLSFAFALVGLTVAFSGPVLAQADGAPAAGSTETPEEITIVGGRPLSEYRLEVEEARLELVDVYNEANSSDANDVTCRNERVTGTRMPQRVCRSKAQSDAEASASMNFLRSLTHSAGNFRSPAGSPPLPGGPQLNASIGAATAQSSAEVLSAESRAAIEAELETLRKENRQVYRAIVKYLEAEDEYNRARGAVAK